MNVWSGMGRLTKDPELRYTTNNVPVCGFVLAVDRDFQKEGEEKQADFIPCVVWQKKGEAAAKHLSKGRRIAVVGSIQTRNYKNNDGNKVYVTEINIEHWYFADDKKKDGTGADQGDAPEQGHQENKPAADRPPMNPPPAGIANAGQGKMPWEQGG